MVGTVKDTVDALLPLINAKTDTGHLDRMTAHYRRTRARLDNLARPGRGAAPLHPQFVAATIDKPTPAPPARPRALILIRVPSQLEQAAPWHERHPPVHA